MFNLPSVTFLSGGGISTTIIGLQDIAAILPLLGTEQCSVQVSSALTRGYLYAAASPMSLFGSLGVVIAGFKTLVACISFGDIEGAKILGNMGFKPHGENLSLIMVEPRRGRYIIETQMDELIRHLNIDKNRVAGVSHKSATWNLKMMATTALLCPFSIVPYYIYLNEGANNLKNGMTWIFPVVRSTGGFIIATLIQLLIQRRITTLSDQYLVKQWQPQPNTDVEVAVEPGDTKKHQTDARTWLLLCLLFIGIVASVVGYVGCFSIVQNSTSNIGPISWLCLECGLSVMRLAIWAYNPTSEAPALEIILKLDNYENKPLPTCNTMLKLLCYVRGDLCAQAFNVEIDKAKSVSDLREVIKEKKRPKFDDIPADSLVLWKVSVHFTESLKNEVEALNLVDGGSLQQPFVKLSNIFSSGLEEGSVQIIIGRPHSDNGFSLSFESTGTLLSLFCYMRGDDRAQAFKVDIDKAKSVSDLKEAIKEKKRPKFDDIPADSLVLWKVSVHFTENLKNEVEALNLVDGDNLQPAEDLSDIFSDLEKKRVHVIIDRPHSGRSSGLSPCNPSAPHERKATEMAWKTTFRGSGAELFLRCLYNMNNGRGEKLYANFLALIQSSGLGKSRLADEIAKLIFTIPFCFRTELDGYPEADAAPRNFFRLRHGDDFDTVTVYDRFLLFLEKLFIVVKREVEKLSTKADGSLPVLWYNHLSLQDGDKTTRQVLYEEVVNVTEKSLGDAKRTPHSSISDDDQRPVYIAAKALIDTINSHTKEISSEENPRPVRLLIYIDESHEMTTSMLTLGDKRNNAYQILCSSLNVLLRLDLFFVFLSTNSKLSDYAPSSRVFWSSRVRNSTLTHVQTPYTELPFDVWKESHIVSEGVHTMDDVCSVEFIVRFGRPLWWTRWEAGTREVKTEMIEFAMMKLAAQNDRGKYTRESFLAALSVRLLLDFEPRRITAIETENLMVAGHLRVANVIPSHREYMYSSTPSEPIVAEAAAQVLRASKESMIESLCNHTTSGLIEKGQRGELAARLLLTLAHDAALHITSTKRQEYQGQTEYLFTRPVPLLDFISALFAPPHIEIIMRAIPDKQSEGPTFAESFKDAYIMFTHFGKAADDWCISDKFAFMALTRNMAIACRERMEFVDLCIPIHFGKEGRLSRDTTSAIFISIKDREAAVGNNSTYIDVSKMKFFTDKSKHRPVVNLILQLGVQSAGRYIPIKRSKAETPGLLATPKRKGRARNERVEVSIPTGTSKTRAKGTPGPAYYTINAFGCSSKVYGVIKQQEEPLWHALLASRDFLSDHSRQETQFLRAVMAQKPIWTSGSECCSWADMGELPSQPDSEVQVKEERPVEGVYVGVLLQNDDDNVFPE